MDLDRLAAPDQAPVEQVDLHRGPHADERAERVLDPDLATEGKPGVRGHAVHGAARRPRVPRDVRHGPEEHARLPLRAGVVDPTGREPREHRPVRVGPGRAVATASEEVGAPAARGERRPEPRLDEGLEVRPLAVHPLEPEPQVEPHGVAGDPGGRVAAHGAVLHLAHRGHDGLAADPEAVALGRAGRREPLDGPRAVLQVGDARAEVLRLDRDDLALELPEDGVVRADVAAGGTRVEGRVQELAEAPAVRALHALRWSAGRPPRRAHGVPAEDRELLVVVLRRGRNPVQAADVIRADRRDGAGVRPPERRPRHEELAPRDPRRLNALAPPADLPDRAVLQPDTPVRQGGRGHDRAGGARVPRVGRAVRLERAHALREEVVTALDEGAVAREVPGAGREAARGPGPGPEVHQALHRGPDLRLLRVRRVDGRRGAGVRLGVGRGRVADGPDERERETHPLADVLHGSSPSTIHCPKPKRGLRFHLSTERCVDQLTTYGERSWSRPVTKWNKEEIFHTGRNGFKTIQLHAFLKEKCSPVSGRTKENSMIRPFCQGRQVAKKPLVQRLIVSIKKKSITKYAFLPLQEANLRQKEGQ